MLNTKTMNGKNPALVPAMEIALVKAGARKTSNIFKIWTWLKDHPKKTGNAVAKALNMPLNTSSAVLSDMMQRGMVAGKKEYSDHTRRDVYFYSALGAAYELLPLPADKRKKLSPAPAVMARAVNAAGDVSDAPAPSTRRRASSGSRLDAEVAGIMAQIKQARAIYQALRKVFGE